MKITCRLISRRTYNEITSTEIEKDAFGLTKDNPFPASEFWTGNVFKDGTCRFTYVVREAFGDLGTLKPEEKVAA
jgi:hypothetical protein